MGRRNQALAALGLMAWCGGASAWFAVPASGDPPITVVSLLPRNEAFTVALGAQGFYFRVSGSVNGCHPGGYTNVMVIPKKDPNNASAENPAYRDSVSSVMLAFSMNRSVTLYLDGCIAANQPGHRVVGIDVN
jgi:hypothetical protein